MCREALKLFTDFVLMDFFNGTVEGKGDKN
jgi:hypothetical protein